MEKKKGLMLIVLALLMALPCAALGVDSFVFEAKVAPAVEDKVELPFEGQVDEVFVQTGDRVAAGDKLLTMQTSKLLALEPGSVVAVFAQPGLDGKTVEETYHASVILQPDPPMYTIIANKTAAAGRENITYTRGETVHLKAKTGSHTGIGRIINVKTYTFTVEILSGDLELGESLNCYRSETFANSKRLGNGVVANFDPTLMNMDGFVVDVLVNPGDVVKSGDALLTYAPSTELSAYAKKDAIVMSADASGSIVLAPIDSLCLSARLSALELSLLEARPIVRITQEGNPDFSAQGTLMWISGVADSDGLYEVRIACPSEITPRIGAAYLIEASDQ